MPGGEEWPRKNLAPGIFLANGIDETIYGIFGVFLIFRQCHHLMTLLPFCSALLLLKLMRPLSYERMVI